MNRSDVLDRIQNIFHTVLDNELIILSESTTTEDVEEWDSLTHVQIIVDVEKEFQIKFTSKEILEWNNIGEMMDCIEKKRL